MVNVFVIQDGSVTIVVQNNAKKTVMDTEYALEENVSVYSLIQVLLVKI